MQFRYQAVDAYGDIVSDTIEAPSLIDASRQLGDKNLEVMAIEALASANRIYEPRATRPPITPRDVKVKLTDAPAAWPLLITGGIFAGIASIFVVSGIVALLSGSKEGLAFALFPLIHLTIGVTLIAITLRNRSRRERLYRHGEVIMARIEAVGYDRSVTVNGNNPFEIVWTFDLNGERYHDKRTTFDPSVKGFAPGEPIWVVYDPHDPENSAEWPPVSARAPKSGRIRD